MPRCVVPQVEAAVPRVPPRLALPAALAAAPCEQAPALVCTVWPARIPAVAVDWVRSCPSVVEPTAVVAVEGLADVLVVWAKAGMAKSMTLPNNAGLSIGPSPVVLQSGKNRLDGPT